MRICVVYVQVYALPGTGLGHWTTSRPWWSWLLCPEPAAQSPLWAADVQKWYVLSVLTISHSMWKKDESDYRHLYVSQLLDLLEDTEQHLGWVEMVSNTGVVTHLINCISPMVLHLADSLFFNVSFHGWPHIDRQWASESTSYYYGIAGAEQKMARNINLLVCL